MQPTDTEVHRALTRKGGLIPENFMLRPGRTPPEDSLSIARTEAKARGALSCHGCAAMAVNKILDLPGLAVQVKRDHLQPDPVNPDVDLLEVMGLPYPQPDDAGSIQYARDLIKAVLRHNSNKS